MRKSMVFITSLLLLTSCREAERTYNFGPITETGAVSQTTVSLLRRGTHVLQINGQDRYYLESRIENLQEFNGQIVAVDGVLEPNTERGQLPVIVVERLRPVSGSRTLHEWRIPSLGIQVSAPEDWEAKIEGNIVTFRRPQDTLPVATLFTEEGTALPEGSTVRLRGRTGVRISLASGDEDLRLIDRQQTLVLQFRLSSAGEITEADMRVLKEQLNALFTSITFLADSSSSSSSRQTTTGTGALIPCGGQAGILCPAGMYCEVFDREHRVGKCRKS